MNWKFWCRWSAAARGIRHNQKLRGPRELPTQVGIYLVAQEKMDPDWVWTLSCVERSCSEHDRHKYAFRLFSGTRARNAGVDVKHYHSLDDHPELILFSGRYNRRGTGIELDRGPSTLAA
jgi:hypothetical protein